MKEDKLVHKEAVLKAIEGGASCEEVVKKYGVSMYFARKWSGDVYRKIDLSHYVRDRYKWDVLSACTDMENEVFETIGSKVVFEDADLAKYFNFVKQRMYGMLEDIVKKN